MGNTVIHVEKQHKAIIQETDAIHAKDYLLSKGEMLILDSSCIRIEGQGNWKEKYEKLLAQLKFTLETSEQYWLPTNSIIKALRETLLHEGANNTKIEIPSTPQPEVAELGLAPTQTTIGKCDICGRPTRNLDSASGIRDCGEDHKKTKLKSCETCGKWEDRNSIDGICMDKTDRKCTLENRECWIPIIAEKQSNTLYDNVCNAVKKAKSLEELRVLEVAALGDSPIKSDDFKAGISCGNPEILCPKQLKSEDKLTPLLEIMVEDLEILFAAVLGKDIAKEVFKTYNKLLATYKEGKK